MRSRKRVGLDTLLIADAGSAVNCFPAGILRAVIMDAIF